MVFSSALFLTRFLPLVLLLYFIADKKYRNLILLASSIIFYSWEAPRFIFILLGAAGLTYFLVKEMDELDSSKQKKPFLALSICVNVALLLYFYCGFFVENINVLVELFGSTSIPWTKIALPVGISFYTLESITYAVDVYRGVYAPQKKFSSYVLYLLFFPKLIAGPIVRYHEIADQLNEREENNENRLAGFIRFCTGLAKKVLIANYLGVYATLVFGSGDGKIPGIDPATLHASSAWIGALAFAFQVYFDFSGYSDMAIGLGRMFGFRLPENFNQPYLAESITDFWKRWYITLGVWMKNYIYIPLGGNRVKPPRLYFNLVLIFLISGLWYGASWHFILWACWHGFFLVAERLFLLKLYAKLFRPLRILLTFFLVLLGWVIFAVPDVTKGFRYIGALFGTGNHSDVLSLNPQLLFYLLLAAFFSVFCYWKRTATFSRNWFEGKFSPQLGFPFATLTGLILLVLSLSYVTSGNFNPFIYFRF